MDKSTVKIHITDRSGLSHLIDAPTDMGMNLMEVIRSYELEDEGTVGICGGMSMCASCQCYINSAHDLKIPSQEERLMLSEAFNIQENSRLSCQIFISNDLDGLKLTIAPGE